MNSSDEPELLLGAAAITAFINRLLAPQKPSHKRRFIAGSKTSASRSGG